MQNRYAGTSFQPQVSNARVKILHETVPVGLQLPSHILAASAYTQQVHQCMPSASSGSGQSVYIPFQCLIHSWHPGIHECAAIIHVLLVALWTSRWCICRAERHCGWHVTPGMLTKLRCCWQPVLMSTPNPFPMRSIRSSWG